MSRFTRVFLALTIFVLAAPILASANPAHAATLKPNFCVFFSFTGGGQFTGAVTHTSKKNDVYQILCEPGGQTCWAWAFNTGSGGTIVSTGLTARPWEWWVCAWSTNSGKTKAQMIGRIAGNDLLAAGRSSEPVEVDLSSPDAPAGVRDMAKRLHQLAKR